MDAVVDHVVSEEIKRLKTELSEAQKQLGQPRDASHRSPHSHDSSHRSPPRSVVSRQPSTRHTDDNDADNDVCSSSSSFSYLTSTANLYFLCLFCLKVVNSNLIFKLEMLGNA